MHWLKTVQLFHDMLRKGVTQLLGDSTVKQWAAIVDRLHRSEVSYHSARGSLDSVDFAPCSKFCLLKEVLPAAIFKGTAMYIFDFNFILR